MEFWVAPFRFKLKKRLKCQGECWTLFSSSKRGHPCVWHKMNLNSFSRPSEISGFGLNAKISYPRSPEFGGLLESRLDPGSTPQSCLLGKGLLLIIQVSFNPHHCLKLLTCFSLWQESHLIYSSHRCKRGKMSLRAI